MGELRQAISNTADQKKFNTWIEENKIGEILKKRLHEYQQHTRKLATHETGDWFYTLLGLQDLTSALGRANLKQKIVYQINRSIDGKSWTEAANEHRETLKRGLNAEIQEAQDQGQQKQLKQLQEKLLDPKTFAKPENSPSHN